jgi:predicted transcriptional regulator
MAVTKNFPCQESVSVSRAARDKLDELAERYGVSRSRVARMALMAGLSAAERELAALAVVGAGFDPGD